MQTTVQIADGLQCSCPLVVTGPNALMLTVCVCPSPRATAEAGKHVGRASPTRRGHPSFTVGVRTITLFTTPSPPTLLQRELVGQSGLQWQGHRPVLHCVLDRRPSVCLDEKACSKQGHQGNILLLHGRHHGEVGCLLLPVYTGTAGKTPQRCAHSRNAVCVWWWNVPWIRLQLTTSIPQLLIA